ncbi:hypothetical protein F4808DRAFT_154613 [Astrocystis sublimbata]|nr:hypothetical protein F4808DRAFT_154613 [Astrocystis sublimbata]
MGQAVALPRIGHLKYQTLPQKCHLEIQALPPNDHLENQVRLLCNSPVDVFLCIADHLSPDALAALSLTCRSFYVLLKRKIKLDCADREAFLCLLEQDLGDRFYYCHFCYRLHPFSPSWTPAVDIWGTQKIRFQGCCYADCPIRGQAFSLANRGLHCIGFPLARLVMNRHFHGAPSGLPLANLQHHFVPWSPKPWTQDWTARIIDDELFLRAAHVFYDQHAVDQTLVHPGVKIGHEAHYICAHYLTDMPTDFRLWYIDAIPELENYRLDRSILCHNVLRSCPRCLTDFETTIEPIKSGDRPPQPMSIVEPDVIPHPRGWRITVVAYHQVGACRSPEDWKWKALVPKNGHEIRKVKRSPVFMPPGAVMQKWQGSD